MHIYTLVLDVFNRNYECLHLFKSSDRLLSVVALSDIIRYFSHKQSWHLLVVFDVYVYLFIHTSIHIYTYIKWNMSVISLAWYEWITHSQLVCCDKSLASVVNDSHNYQCNNALLSVYKYTHRRMSNTRICSITAFHSLSIAVYKKIYH